MKPFVLSMSILLATTIFAAAPDMRKLAQAGRVIHSEVETTKEDKGWTKFNEVMKDVDIFDHNVGRMMSTLCAPEVNKSVLLVGEPSETFKYLWARLAKMAPLAGCQKLSHVDIDISKLQGYMYVGTTERKWQDFIERPAYNKDVVIYFNNLARLIGVGTSSNRDVGIEATYVAALQAGKLKTISFINSYDYNRLIRSRHAYVLNAFQETVNIDEIDAAKVSLLVKKYFEIHGSHLDVSKKVLTYMTRNANYYQPNILEPQRSINIVNGIIRNAKKAYDFKYPDIQTPDPYTANMDETWVLDYPDAKFIQINFSYFKTDYADILTIYDENTGAKLDEIRRDLSKLQTKKYPTNKLKLHFKSDSSYQKRGFKVSSVMVYSNKKVVITMDDVRAAILKAVHVPEWMLDRDFTIIKDLPAKLNGDVVGVKDGKKAVIRQLKIGYVAGRTDEKPAGSIMLVGPTGTGKSYIAKKTAEFLNLKLITLDMTQYATDESFDRFLDTVANYLILYPYAVYLFEEIDKANVRILDRLFFMMDEGIFYDKSQRPLFARGSFILMTTNAGHDLIIKQKDNPDLKSLVHKELQKYYRPSFLNRFDAVSIFLPFTQKEFQQLANIMVAKKAKKMEEYFNWSFSIDSESLLFLGKNGGSDLYGARPMERLIENLISIGISEYQIQHETIAYGSQIALSKVSGEKNKFKLMVNRDKSVEFEVDLDNNNGHRFMMNPLIMAIFEQSRLYL